MGCKGYRHTALAKALIARTHRGKPKTAEHRQKLRDANLGKTLSLETRMKMSEYGKAHPNAGHFKPGSSNPWNRGLKTPEQVKAKMRAAHRTPAQLAIAYATRARQVFPKRDTSIERVMQAELNRRGVPFKVHTNIVPHHQCDVFIPPNLVIECDGEYWHRLPARRLKDHQDNVRMAEAGLVVFRFWEKEIKADVRGCVDRLQPHISSFGRDEMIGRKLRQKVGAV